MTAHLSKRTSSSIFLVPCYYQGGHRVTQHFMDALGRETNTLVRPAMVEGAAVDANLVYDKGWRTSETAVYLDGTSDYAVRTDMRGVRTITRSDDYSDRTEYQTQIIPTTNLVTPVSSDLSISYRNGSSVTQRAWEDQWTRATRSTAYDASGCRIDTQVAEASDQATVTNSVTVSDFLGRTVATVTPLGVTSNFYDGASMRILTAIRTGQPPIQSLYNTFGEQIGTIVSGITNRTDVSYDTVAGEVWRVADSLSGEARSVIRERLTGLSDALRRHTVAIGANGVTNEIIVAWDEPTRTLTETQTSSLRATPFVRVGKYGRTVFETSVDNSRNYFFDPYGRVFYTERRPSGSVTWLSETWLGFSDFGDTEESDTFTSAGSTYTATFQAFDAFGRTITTTDALGNAVTNAYDTLGRQVAASGATYPVRHGCDSMGRMKELGTTRNGDVWDTTQWQYDPATGLCTAKTYADNSIVAYTHTLDGKPLRTTWARGARRESSYNADGLLAAIAYSDTTPDVSLAYDAFQRLSAASNAVAADVYANDTLGAVTNEMTVIGENTQDTAREYDEFRRLAKLTTAGDAVCYGYDTETRLATVSNDTFAVDYAYTSDGWDAGYTATLKNGTTVSRSLTRDVYRRDLVKTITNSVNGVSVNSLTYSHDALNRATSRNTDAFGYNVRSEVISADIATNAFRYAFDGMGNNQWTAVNGTTNSYTANALNQYTSILRAPAPPREPTYDLDGNMIWDGVFTYAWDAENRLIAAYSNSALVVSNAYDHMSRRVLKFTPTATHTFIYDGWNLVVELIHTQTQTLTTRYVWGKELSGTLQGAGGVGGLLAIFRNGTPFFPCYDVNGNVTDYVDVNGTVVAHREYNPFGKTVTASGALVHDLSFWFSTKYLDAETDLYYYSYRFYSAELMRWINRDPFENLFSAFTQPYAVNALQHASTEYDLSLHLPDAGNLYLFVRNNSLWHVDAQGLMARRLPSRPVMVGIYLKRVDSDASVRTDDMIRALRRMDSKLKWNFVTGPLPSGTGKGKQPSNQYDGKCYRHVYFVEAELSSSGGSVFPLGYGNDFPAIVWADRTKRNFDRLDLTGSLDSRISELGRDAAFYQIGGFMLAHEVLHSVGARHFGDERFVMTRVPTWDWILRWPVVSQETVNRVKRRLDVRE